MSRPRKPDAKKLQQRSIRMLPKHWARVDVMGLDWLRGLVEKSVDKPVDQRVNEEEVKHDLAKSCLKDSSGVNA